MKVKVLFAALASLVLASCTNNELFLDESKKGQEIRFAVAPGTEQSRAEHDMNGPYDGDLLIWAWKKGTNTVIIPGKIYHTSSKTFENNVIYYYPVDGSDVDFLAIPKDVKDVEYVSDPQRTAEGNTSWTFHVGHENHNASQHQVDIMTSEIVTKATDVVPLVLRHLTTKLNLRIIQNKRFNEAAICSVKLNNVELRSLKNHGQVTLDQDWTAVNATNDGADHMWDQVKENTCNWTILPTSEKTYHVLASLDLDENVNQFQTNDDYFVVPQLMEQGVQKLYLNYDVISYYQSNDLQITEKFEKELDLSTITAIPAWAMNKNITYIIYIDPLEEHHKISFTVEVEAWGNVNNDNGTTITTSGSTNITPSVSTEDLN